MNLVTEEKEKACALCSFEAGTPVKIEETEEVVEWEANRFMQSIYSTDIGKWKGIVYLHKKCVKRQLQREVNIAKKELQHLKERHLREIKNKETQIASLEKELASA